MWVRLKSVQYIDVHGKSRTYYPGDWVEVGKQTALLWIAQGGAELPSAEAMKKLTNAVDTGILVEGDAQAQIAQSILKTFNIGLTVQEGPPYPRFERTLIWNSASLRPELVPVGLGLLDTWQIAVPMANYKQLASTVGTQEERDVTQSIIRDLRVPTYETGIMFVRKCQEITDLLRMWQKDIKSGHDPRLSFLRALYTVKPLILALPFTWHTREAMTND